MIVKSYEEKKITDEKINILLFYGKNDGFLNAVLEKLFLKSFDGLINMMKLNSSIITILLRIDVEIVI